MQIPPSVDGGVEGGREGGREKGREGRKEGGKAGLPSGTSAPEGIHLCKLQMEMGTMRTPAALAMRKAPFLKGLSRPDRGREGGREGGRDG